MDTERMTEIKQNLLDTDGAQVSASFSSFISCYSLCIAVEFQSDAAHRLENCSKMSLRQWCGTSESLEQLGRRCETKKVCLFMSVSVIQCLVQQCKFF